MRLYEYDAALAECWDPETGEILDQERMDALDLERDEKIDNICSYIKDLTTDAAAVKEEKQKLAARQASLEKKAPKNLYNSFGKYNYRNAESILEAFKPYGAEYGLTLTIKDEITQVGDRFYVKATASIMDAKTGGSAPFFAVSAFAREADTKAGMDPAQITGSASSYARKYALNGLFLLDDTKDPDSEEQARQAEKEKPAAKKPAPAKEERKPKTADDKIGQLEAAALRRELTRTGVSEWSMLKSYGVDRIEDMTQAQWRDAGEILASKPDREVKA